MIRWNDLADQLKIISDVTYITVELWHSAGMGAMVGSQKKTAERTLTVCRVGYDSRPVCPAPSDIPGRTIMDYVKINKSSVRVGDRITTWSPMGAGSGWLDVESTDEIIPGVLRYNGRNSFGGDASLIILGEFCYRVIG